MKFGIFSENLGRASGRYAVWICGSISKFHVLDGQAVSDRLIHAGIFLLGKRQILLVLHDLVLNNTIKGVFKSL